MVLFSWRGQQLMQRLRRRLEREYFMLRLTFWSLFYNSLTSWNTVLDTLLEPLFWFVDHFVRYLGPAFVMLVVVLVSSVIIIFYTCLLPEYYKDNWMRTLYHLVVGHWLLVNTAFHYFKAAFMDPGHPPEEIPEVVSICKKCISPKPPRAHHCSVCDICILKMDHHCPWLNNCVGHNNHRHFFMFCFFMWIGTVYVSTCAYTPFKKHFFGTADIGVTNFIYHWQMIKEKLSLEMSGEVMTLPPNMTAAGQRSEDKLTQSIITKPTRSIDGLHFHHFITYEFLLCSAVCVAVGLLTLWHARLIHRGETSIEVHINRRESDRFRAKGMVYRNPYSYGPLQNWKNFLGLTRGRTFWRHVMLPSGHLPDSDGLRWQLTTNNEAGLLNL